MFSFPAFTLLFFLGDHLTQLFKFILRLNDSSVDSELVVEVKHDLSIIIYREYIDQIVPVTNLGQLLWYPLHMILIRLWHLVKIFQLSY